MKGDHARCSQALMDPYTLVLTCLKNLIEQSWYFQLGPFSYSCSKESESNGKGKLRLQLLLGSLLKACLKHIYFALIN